MDTPLHVSQKLGGCESVQMVRKVAHLSGTHLAEHKDRVTSLKLVAAVLVATIRRGAQK